MKLTDEFLDKIMTSEGNDLRELVDGQVLYDLAWEIKTLRKQVRGAAEMMEMLGGGVLDKEECHEEIVKYAKDVK